MICFDFDFSYLDYDFLISIANSNFITSSLGALAGAVAGAWAAQKIVERNKHRDEFIKEIHSINVAIALVGSFANTMLELKKQQVIALKSDFETALTVYHDHDRKIKEGEIPPDSPDNFPAKFGVLAKMSTPVDIISDLVFTKMTAPNRAICLLMSLNDTVEKLNDIIEKRNLLIQNFKSNKFPDGAGFVSMYLGLPYGGGHINEEYKSTIYAIASFTDDAIFFSRLLCHDLHEYGLKVSKKFEHSIKEVSPTINKMDFKQAEEDKLIPPDEDYPDWFSAFVTRN